MIGRDGNHFALDSIENAKQGSSTSSDKEDSKRDPTKDLVSGHLVAGKASFIFSAHGVQVSDIFRLFLFMDQ